MSCVLCILFVPPFTNQYLCTTLCVLNHIDIIITEGTLMIRRVVHLSLKNVFKHVLTSCYNKRLTHACKHLMCCEEITVRLDCLKMVSVESETRRSIVWYISVD